MQETGNNPHTAYSLSIRLHADGFSFYSYCTYSEPIIKKEDYSFQPHEPHAATLENALKASPLTHLDNLMVYGLLTSPSVQVPLEAFQKEEAGTLYRLTFKQNTYGKIYYNILPHLEIAEIFTVEKELEEVLCQYFPHICFYHIHTMLLEKLALQTMRESQKLYAYFHEKEVFIFSTRQQQLYYANTFPIEQTANAVYFILSVWKSLGLEAESHECILLGSPDITAEVTTHLNKYLRHLRTLQPTDIYKRAPLAQVQGLPFDLLTLLLNIV